MRRPTSFPLAGGLRSLALLGALAWVCVPRVASAQAAPAPANTAAGVGPAPVATAPAPAGPVLPADVQLVEIQVPPGVQVALLGPASEPVPQADTARGLRFGLKVGITYWLRLTNLPERPGIDLYPAIELVGHLHRPPEIDPGRFPIRVAFRDEDLDDVLVRGRLVTQVIYLEDPEQALPMELPKDELPVVQISPAENPLKVSAALGRPMAVVKVGSRIPNPDEWNGAAFSSMPLAACPYTGASGARCGVPCGPSRPTAPPASGSWLPRDEYLCDGGDHGQPAHFGTTGGLRGVDPRDAMLKFQTQNRPRVLPTNVVCLYAPRFAAVRSSLGASAALTIIETRTSITAQRDLTEETTQIARRLTQNNTALAYRHHARLSSLGGRVIPFEHTELRILQGYDDVASLAGNITVQGPESARRGQKANLARKATAAVQIRTAESAIVTGIVQGASTAIMSWLPHDVVGVEVPPDRPGMAVIKRVSADTAEPGDVVTFSIQFRNMGNTPIASVSVVDSLLPRLEYVGGSAQGPKGTVFTASPNTAGSTELRWDLQGALAPGAEGYVSFQAKVR